MGIRGLLNWRFAKRLLAVFALAFIIPQAIQLLIKLAWAIIIIIASFLIFELCVVFVIRAWFPDKVNVAHVAEWTINTLLRVGSSLFNVMCNLMYSCFDLVFGKVFQGAMRVQRKSATRNQSSVKSAPDQIKSIGLSRDGYTSMARKAMTNSATATKPNRPARFSL